MSSFLSCFVNYLLRYCCIVSTCSKSDHELLYNSNFTNIKAPYLTHAYWKWFTVVCSKKIIAIMFILILADIFKIMYYGDRYALEE